MTLFSNSDMLVTVPEHRSMVVHQRFPVGDGNVPRLEASH